jgi:hypothetical protein
VGTEEEGGSEKKKNVIDGNTSGVSARRKMLQER